MGRADVNSSIGASWNQEGRVKAMQGAAEDVINAGNGSQKMNVQLEVCRGRGLR
jgi:Novel toxin 15